MKSEINFRKSIPYLPLLIGAIVMFFPIIILGKVFFWGLPSMQFVPWWYLAWSNLRQGVIPLWNPYVGMGAPLLANYQSGIFYPPNWLHAVLFWIGGLKALAQGMSLLIVFHILVAGVGMVQLTRHLQYSVLAQAISGIAFAFSGYVIARASFVTINAAIAWFPWIVLFATKLCSEKGLKNVLVLGILFGMQLLAGHAQTTWYTILFTSVWYIFFVFVSFRKERELKQGEKKWERFFRFLKYFYLRIRLYLAAVFLGVGLASVQLLPTAEYLLQSQRSSSVAYDFAMNYSFWPWRFLDLIAPNMFGNPAWGDYWGYGYYWEDAVYFGLIPFLTSILVILKTLVNSLKRKKRIGEGYQEGKVIYDKQLFMWFLIIATVVVFIFALGKNTPVFPWIYWHVPGFAMFQAPTRISFLAIFCLILLSGFGFDTWQRPTKRALYWTRLGTMGAFAVMVGAGLAYFMSSGIKISLLKATAMSGMWGLGFGVLSLIAPLKRDDKEEWSFWHSAVVFIICIDLIVAGWHINPWKKADFYTENPENVNNVKTKLDGHRLYFPLDDEYKIKYDEIFVPRTYSPNYDWELLSGTLLANINIIKKVSVANNYDPMLQARYDIWMERIGELPDFTQGKLLDLMDVSAVGRYAPEELLKVRIEARNGNSTRARLVPCAVYVNSADEAWQRLIATGFQPETTIIVEKNNFGGESELCKDTTTTIGNITIARESLNTIEIQIDAYQNSWMLLADTYYPGWRAYLDGKETELYRADYLFRGVAVPEGKHVVTMVYKPIIFYVGALISFLVLIFIIYLFTKEKKHIEN